MQKIFEFRIAFADAVGGTAIAPDQPLHARQPFPFDFGMTIGAERRRFSPRVRCRQPAESVILSALITG